MIGAHASPALPRSMALAATILSRPGLARAFAGNDDPLRLELPPLGGTASGAAIQPQTIETMAVLYLQAELEQAGVLAVAELLAEARGGIPLRDRQAAMKLDQFATRGRRDWYDRRTRNLLFARVFGTGPAATNESGVTINREFELRLAEFCLALNRYEQDLRWSPRPSAGREVAVRLAATTLLRNLAARRFGSTLFAARKIQEQLQLAIELLSHRGITAEFQARNMWDLIRRILGADAPDLERLVTRGQSGMRLLKWLASIVPQLRDSRAVAPIVGANRAVFVWAAAWLQATGLQPDETEPRRLQ